MVDLHCHILPHIDDGAPSTEAACNMAKRALHSGVDTIVATPHCNLPGFRANYRDADYAHHFRRLRTLLLERDIPIQLLPGAEVFADPSNICRLIEQERLLTLNGSRYLLVEFDFSTPAAVLCRTLEEIALHGLIPVIAHPERYDAVQRDPHLASLWFSQGFIIQINKGSILGLLGRHSRHTAQYLLEYGLAHVIASDAHDTVHRTSGFRTLIDTLGGYCSAEYIKLLLDANPRHIILDEPVPIPGASHPEP